MGHHEDFSKLFDIQEMGEMLGAVEQSIIQAKQDAAKYPTDLRRRDAYLQRAVYRQKIGDKIHEQLHFMRELSKRRTKPVKKGLGL